MQDKADIVSLIKTGKASDLKDFNLPDKQQKEYQELLEIAKTDMHP